MEYNSKSLTREGATMLALADKEEKALIIDEVIVSEKVITAGTDISALTMADFANPLTYGISSKVQSDNQFSVKSVITNHWQDSANTDHTTNKDFNVALVGVVAHVDSFADQHVLTVAVGNDPFVLPAYQGTDVSFVFGITQAYSASQNVTIKMDGSAYALATDLDDIKNLQGSIGIAIDSKLADYVKTDDVEKLIPATVIDGSKPADFKEAVTLEKGAVDGAGNTIATTKDLADGDATTLKSAKEYADTQVGDKVKAADTANWQKTKISADDGSPKSFLYAKDNGNITMWIAGRPLGMHTFWCAAGVTGNPVSSSIQGTMSISSVKNGVGYCVSADGDFISITLVDGQVNYDILTKKSDIDPSVMTKTTPITNTTDLFTLDPGTYFGNNVTPVNGPAVNSLPTTNYFWVKLETPKANALIKKLTWTDNGNHQYVNEYYGVSAKWHDWQILNENSVVKDNGDDTVTINGKSYVPANAANVVDRNPDTGVVSEPVDFTKLTVNGGKSVATSDDLKSIEDASWHTIISDNYSGLCMMKYNTDIGTMSLSGTIFPQKYSAEGSRVSVIIPLPDGFSMGTNADSKATIWTNTNGSVQKFSGVVADLKYESDGIHIIFDKIYSNYLDPKMFIILDDFFAYSTANPQSNNLINFKVTKN